MHKKIFLVKVCAVALVALGCSISKGDDNLLSNPSFETAGSDSYAEDWGTYQCGYTRSSDQSKTGSWSCKITGAGTASEIGLGGCNSGVTSGLPASEKFMASSNIYISSYTQGTVYGIYLTVNYTDSSQDIFYSKLSSSEITANLNTWKKYSKTFITDPDKTLSSITMWCLVWIDNGDKFIGTVYFDDVKLEVFKPVVYWNGDRIYSATNNTQAADDVLNRGFTHAVVSQYEPSNFERTIFLDGEGFDVVKNITPTSYASVNTYSPRSYSPYNDNTNYNDTVQALADMLDDYPEVTGIIDDIEQIPFPSIRYSADGATAYESTYSDLEERIGNETPQCTGWPIFKNWPTSGDHNVSNLTMENIEYNFPSLSVDISGTPDGFLILGYYGSGFTYESYEMVAQTFKPVYNRITRIDVLLRRYGSSTEYPLGNIYYYLTEVDANGEPDLDNKISYNYCTIRSNEVDYSTVWTGVEPIALYFDPVDIGTLDTTKKYALILEFTKKNSNDWNGAFYRVAGYSSDVYSNGEAYMLRYGSWVQTNDIWMKAYKPNPPTGFALNQFHEDWIDFQGAVAAKYIEEYRDIADSVTPARQVWIYSGYTGGAYPTNTHNYDGTTRRAYTANWQMFSEAGIDFAVCGYGIQSITATINALVAGNSSNTPKLIGGAMYPGLESVWTDRYENCDGAMLYYYDANDDDIVTYADDPGWSVP